MRKRKHKSWWILGYCGIIFLCGELFIISSFPIGFIFIFIADLFLMAVLGAMEDVDN